MPDIQDIDRISKSLICIHFDQLSPNNIRQQQLTLRVICLEKNTQNVQRTRIRLKYCDDKQGLRNAVSYAGCPFMDLIAAAILTFIHFVFCT